MRAPLVLVLAWVVALSGCLGPTAGSKDTYKDRTVTAVIESGVSPVNRTGDQFYFVWISGGEHVKRIAGKGEVPLEHCDSGTSVEYDVGAGVLRYDARTNPIATDGLQVLVALEYRGDRVFPHALGKGCATLSTVQGYDGRAEFRHAVRPDITIDLVGEPQNGFLTYNKGYFFPIGKKVHVNLTRVQAVAGGHSFYSTGDFEVVNLGLWTADRLAPR